MSDYSGAAEADFQRARTRAFLRKIMALLSKRSNELLSFEHVKDKVKAHSFTYRGLKTVEVNKIVGSVDRYRDFDRHFLPAQDHTKDRWKSIDRAFYGHVPLPPIKLYKVGQVYFVRDGHHRLSVAREKGVEFIDAEVIECQARVPVTPDMRPEDLVIKGEYAEFLERTRLDRIRPGADIEFTIAGNYEALWEHISVHRYYLGQERREEVPLEEAVASWYDRVYLPIVQAIREQEVLADFPRRTEADLYLWIMDHLYYLRERYGQEIDVEEAAAGFAEQFSQRPVKKAQRAVRHTIESIATETPFPAVAPDEWPLGQTMKNLEVIMGLDGQSSDPIEENKNDKSERKDH